MTQQIINTVLRVQWTGSRLIAVLSLLGQQQQFHAFAFASQRGGPFFASPLVDPLQPLPNPLQPLPNPLQPRDPLSSFRHAMPGNCQSKSELSELLTINMILNCMALLVFLAFVILSVPLSFY